MADRAFARAVYLGTAMTRQRQKTSRYDDESSYAASLLLPCDKIQRIDDSGKLCNRSVAFQPAPISEAFGTLSVTMKLDMVDGQRRPVSPRPSMPFAFERILEGCGEGIASLAKRDPSFEFLDPKQKTSASEAQFKKLHTYDTHERAGHTVYEKSLW